jgi:hypothetical protein
MGRRIALVVFAVGAWGFLGTSAAHAQTESTTTTAPSTTVERTTASTGPNDYLYVVGAAGVIALAAGSRMRGRRPLGSHWI